MKLSQMAALEIVILATSSAVSGENFVKMTLPFQRLCLSLFLCKFLQSSYGPPNHLAFVVHWTTEDVRLKQHCQ